MRNLSTLLILLGLYLGTAADASAQFPNVLKPKKKKDATEVLKKESRWDYLIADNKPSSKGVLAAEATYNTKGDEENLLIYKSDGSLKQRYTYKQDLDQHQVQRFWEQDGKQVKDFSEELDALGNVIKRVRYKADGQILDITLYKYDAKGRKIEEQYFNEAHKMVYEMILSYNDAQQSLTEKLNDMSINEEYVTTVQLDANDQPLSRTRYKKSGQLVDKITYKRDEKGRLTEKLTYPDGKKAGVKELYQYDDTNNKLTYSVIDSESGKLLEYAVFAYEYYNNK